MGLGPTDFVLKRFLKFVLKRKLGKYLHELDLAALDLDIGSAGVGLDVRNILLKCEQVTADLALDGWEVRACYLGHVKAQLPFSALGSMGGECSVQCDELLVTIAAVPGTAHAKSEKAGATESTSPTTAQSADPSNTMQSGVLEELDMLSSTNASAEDVIQRIAGGLHTMLQQLSVKVTNILVRLELPLAHGAAAGSPLPTIGSGQVAVYSLSIDSICLVDCSHLPAPASSAGPGPPVATAEAHQSASSWWSTYATSYYYLGGMGGAPLTSPAAAPVAPTAASAAGSKQVHKQLEVSGVRLHLHVGPPIRTSADTTSEAAAEGAATPSATAPPPLLSDPGGKGVSLTIRACVTSLSAAPSPAHTGYTPDQMMQPPVPTKVSVQLHMGACLVHVAPEHYPCIAAGLSLVEHMQRRQQAGQEQPSPAGVPACSEGVLAPSPNGMMGPAYHDEGGRAGGQEDAQGQAGVWGTTSLLSSFLLDDYHQLVAMSLQPYVAQSLSLAESHFSDTGGAWSHGVLSYSQLCSPAHGSPAASPPHHRSAGPSSGSMYPGRPRQHQPDSFQARGSDAGVASEFHDARSAFSSYPSSMASSMHGGAHTQVPRPAWSTPSHPGAAFSPTSMLHNGEHNGPTVLAPPPPPPPEYHLELRMEQLHLLLGFRGPEGAESHEVHGAEQPAGGLLLSTTEVDLQCHITAEHLSGSLELQQLQVMELVPAADCTSSAAGYLQAGVASTALARMRAHEFASIPSKLHKGMNCYRPDPSWLTTPAWLAVTTGSSSSSSSSSRSMAPVAWPVLYSGTGVRAPGVRPSLSIRVHKPTAGAGTSRQHSHLMYDPGLWPGQAIGLSRPWSGHMDRFSSGGMSISEAAGGTLDRQATRIQVELLPVTVWVCPEGAQRIQQGCQHLLDALASKGAEAAANCTAIDSVAMQASAAAYGQPAATNQQLPELELTVSIPHICLLARMPLCQPTTTDGTVGPAMQQQQQQQQVGRASRIQRCQQDSMYLLLDMLCPSHQDHVSHQRVLPHQGPPLIRLVCGKRPNELLVRSAVTCEVAAARLRLHAIHAAPPSTSAQHASSHGQHADMGHTLMSASYPAPYQPHLHSRHALHVSPPPATRWVVVCFLEVAPRGAAAPAASSGHQPATGLGVRTGSEDLPPGCGLFASIQWEPSAQPAALTGPCDVLEYVGHYVEAHASSRWCDEEYEGNAEAQGAEGPGWGGRSSPGPGSIRSIQLEEQCKNSAQVFVHARLSSAHVELSVADLEMLSSLHMAPVPGPASTSTPARSAPVPRQPTAPAAAIQITTIIQAHVQVTLKSADMPACSSGAPKQASAPPAYPLAQESGESAAAGPLCFKLRLGEVSMLHVAAVGGVTGASLLSVSAQDVLLTKVGHTHLDSASSCSKGSQAASARNSQAGQGRAGNSSVSEYTVGGIGGATVSRHKEWWRSLGDQDLCLLYCPTRPHSSSPQPCINVLFYKPPHGLLSAGARPTLSVLVRGVTISTDHGSLNLSWAQELAGLLAQPMQATPGGPPTAPDHGTSKQQEPKHHAAAPHKSSSNQAIAAAEPTLRLVVTLQDIALRHEPLGYPSHEVAAGYVAARCPEQATVMAAATGSPSHGSTATTGGGHGAPPSAAAKSTSKQVAPIPSAVAMVLLAEHVRYERGGDSTSGTATGPGVASAGQSNASAEAGARAGDQEASTQQHLVLINSIGLHLAMADSRGVGWSPSECFDVAGCRLQSCGYHCVLSETALRVVICVASAPTAATATGASHGTPPTAQSDGAATCVDVKISNQQVLGVLTQDSAALLLQLSAQLGAYIAAAGAPPVTTATKAQPHMSNPGLSVSRGSMVAEAGGVAFGQRGAVSPTQASREDGFESVRARTEDIMRQLLAQDQFFRGDADAADNLTSSAMLPGATLKQSHSERALRPAPAGGGVWYDQGSTPSEPSRTSLHSSSSNPNIVIIDDFFKVSTAHGNAAPAHTDALSDWEHMPVSSARLYPVHAGPPLRNSPPEAGGVWYPPELESTGASTLVTPPHSLAAGLTVPAAGRGVAPVRPDPVGRSIKLQQGGAAPTSSSRAVQGSAAVKAELPGVVVCEDYMAAGAPPGAQAMRQGPAAQRPKPVLRITLSNFAGLSVLHTTRGSGVQAGRVEAEVEGATLVVDIYPQGGHAARLIHLSIRDLEIRDCRLLQQVQPSSSSTSFSAPGEHHMGSWGASPFGSFGSQGAAKGYAAAARVGSGLAHGVGAAAQATLGAAQVTLGSAAKLAVGLPPGRGHPRKWVKILSYRQRCDQPRDSRAAQLEVVLESVRPDPLHQPSLEEMRLQVRLLPVRLHLDQDVLQYLVAFGSAVLSPHTAAALQLLGQLQLAAQSGGEAPVLPFFQHVHVAPCSFTIDYRPRRIDVAALRAGSLVELLGMVPLGGLELDMVQVLLSGVAGWDQLGTAVAKEWITHIAQTQAHKFLLGLAPVHAVARVASAVSSILGAPPVTRHVSRGVALAASAATDTMAGLRRLQEGRMAMQVREGVVALARLLVAEALAAKAQLGKSSKQDAPSPSGAARALDMHQLPTSSSTQPMPPPAPAATQVPQPQQQPLTADNIATRAPEPLPEQPGAGSQVQVKDQVLDQSSTLLLSAQLADPELEVSTPAAAAGGAAVLILDGLGEEQGGSQFTTMFDLSPTTGGLPGQDTDDPPSWATCIEQECQLAGPTHSPLSLISGAGSSPNPWSPGASTLGIYSHSTQEVGAALEDVRSVTPHSEPAVPIPEGRAQQDALLATHIAATGLHHRMGAGRSCDSGRSGSLATQLLDDELVLLMSTTTTTATALTAGSAGSGWVSVQEHEKLE